MNIKVIFHLTIGRLYLHSKMESKKCWSTIALTKKAIWTTPLVDWKLFKYNKTMWKTDSNLDLGSGTQICRD